MFGRPKPRAIGALTASTFLTAASLICVGGVVSQAADGDAAKSAAAAPGDAVSNEALLKQLQAMEQRIKVLESKLKEKKAAAPVYAADPKSVGGATASGGSSPGASDPAGSDPGKPEKKKKSASALDTPTSDTPPGGIDRKKTILGMIDSPVGGLSIGAYGELRFGAQQNPSAGGQWQNGFDASRLVLLPTYQITDNIIFNAEIEFEHAGTGFDADDKLHGTAEIEQVWVDFKIADPFNWRAPGIDLIPIGYINEHHEPTQFYSVFRPELYNGLIPSTWKAPATSVYGTIADGLTYQIQASSSLEDFGGDFGTRTDANTVPPFPAGYAPGIDGANALSFSLPVRGDYRQLSDDVAVAAKLDYSPPFLPGFSGSTSAYWTPNTTPRGAYADTGVPLGRSSLFMFDSEFRFRPPTTGLELRGEVVYVTFGNPANLRANNDTDPTDNVGKSMYGYSGEVAYHVPLGTILNSEWEAVPFYRYTYQNLQTGGFAGTDVDAPTGAGQTQFHNVGIAVFPSPNLVLKGTYQHVINRSALGALSDSFMGGVGFFF